MNILLCPPKIIFQHSADEWNSLQLTVPLVISTCASQQKEISQYLGEDITLRFYENFNDNPQVELDLYHFGHKNGATGIYFLAEIDVLRVARISDRLKLTHGYEQSAILFRDKYLMKSRVQDYQFSIPEMKRADSPTSIATLLRIPIASPNANKIARLLACGQLEHLHGHIVIQPLTEGFLISASGSKPFHVNKVINASGISNDPKSYPLASRLVQYGIAAAHPFGGLKICQDSLCLRDKNDQVVPGIKCLGQLTVGEYYAVGNIDVLHYQAKKAVESHWYDIFFDRGLI